MAKLIGNAPNQVPTNADLGKMAFEDKVSVANLNATGTKDATTFLRGDNTFQTIGTNTPAFKAYLSANSDTLNHDTLTVVPLASESFDIGSKFDTATYRFTPAEIGYYYLTGTCAIDWISGASYLRQASISVLKNGSSIGDSIITNFNSPDMEVIGISVNVIDYSSNVTDYYQLAVYQNNGSGLNSRRMRGSAAGERTFFCGQKLIT